MGEGGGLPARNFLRVDFRIWIHCHSCLGRLLHSFLWASVVCISFPTLYIPTFLHSSDGNGNGYILREGGNVRGGTISWENPVVKEGSEIP